MKTKQPRFLGFTIAAIGLLLFAFAGHLAAQSAVTVVMSGLDNPRGLAFAPDGALYVAEAGRGGDGPSLVARGETLFYGPTGAVSRFWRGQQQRVVRGLPSLAVASGMAATGPHDVSPDGRGGLYVSVGLGFADPSRRVELGDVAARLGQLLYVSPNGDVFPIADVARHEARENPAGGPIDSNPYGVIADAGSRTMTDAGSNALLNVTTNGGVWTIATFPSRPARSTDSVPTSVAIGPDGAYYVGELTGIPFAVGAARVYRVVLGRDPEVFLEGFTAILDLTFGPDRSLYVLQHASGPGLTGSGALIRVAPNGTRTTVASAGLVSPTSVAVGPDGALYVSNRGIFPGTGEVLRIVP
jgi:sugar lactone lactonase YvrE